MVISFYRIQTEPETSLHFKKNFVENGVLQNEYAIDWYLNECVKLSFGKHFDYTCFKNKMNDFQSNEQGASAKM